MAKGRQARERKRQEKEHRRRRQEKRRQGATPVVKKLTPKLADKIDDTYDLIRTGKFAEAEQLLDRLDGRYDGYPAIVEAQLYLYQTTKNHERSCRAAKQLAKLTPRDPDARLMYAQESMFCGRIGIALVNYQLFLHAGPIMRMPRKQRKPLS